MKRHFLMFAIAIVIATTAKSSATTISYKQGGGTGFADVSVASTYVSGKTDGDQTDNNYGTSGFIYVRRDSSSYQRSRGLFAFEDIFGSGVDQIPYGATINSASLYLYKTNDTGGVANVQLYRVTQSWVEGTGGEPADPSEGVTWDNFDQTGTNIAHVDLTDVQTQSLLFSGGYTEWNVLSMMQYWADNPGENYGWMVVNGGINDLTLYSEDSSETRVPYLVVDFSAPVVVVPEPASLILLGISAVVAVKRFTRRS